MIRPQQKRRAIPVCSHHPQGVDFSFFNTRGRVLAANRGHALLARIRETMPIPIEMLDQEVGIA